MKEVTVDKTTLLKKLHENRANHNKIFEEAIDGYRKKVISLLEKNLASAKAGRRVLLHEFGLAQPINQIKDYDRAIAMLEMALDNKVTISEQDFNAYVMDEWGWRNQFLRSNSMYSATATMALGVEADEDEI